MSWEVGLAYPVVVVRPIVAVVGEDWEGFARVLLTLGGMSTQPAATTIQRRLGVC